MKNKDEVIALLTGSIESANHDDLRAERDRLLSLVQNIEGLNVKDYRRMVKALITANDTIEAVSKGRSVGVVKYVIHALRNYLFDPGYRANTGYK